MQLIKASHTSSFMRLKASYTSSLMQLIKASYTCSLKQLKASYLRFLELALMLA